MEIFSVKTFSESLTALVFTCKKVAMHGGDFCDIIKIEDRISRENAVAERESGV